MSSEATYIPNTLSHTDGVRGTPSLQLSSCESSLSANPTAGILAEATDEELLAQVSLGSKDALGLLFRRHHRAVFNVAWRILRDTSEAEDLRQEVFLFLFQKAMLFNASKGAGASWIIQVTYHRAIDRRRHLDFRQHYDIQELNEERFYSSAGQPSIGQLDGKAALEQLREHLSPEQRQTLELHFFEGYTLREISEKNGQTLGNVRNHFYRGLERLRSQFFPRKRD
jgi:RNA polymerase sigma-70 factor, ECF subfamily